MEEIKMSQLPGNKGSLNEMKYDLEFIVQMNDLAKKVAGFNPKVVARF